MKILGCLFAVLTLIHTSALADPDISRYADDFSSAVGAAGLNAVAVLQELKKLETLAPGHAAQERLSQIAPLFDAFESARDDAEDQWESFQKAKSWWQREIGRGKTEPAGWDDNLNVAQEQRKNLEKYSKLVKSFWRRSVGRYGPLLAQRTRTAQQAPSPSLAGAGQGRLRAVLSAGGGTAQYKQKYATPQVDQTTTIANIQADGSYGLADGTQLIAKLSRDSRVEQRAIVLTQATAAVEHAVGSAVIRAGAGMDWYSESDDEDVGATPLSGNFNEKKLEAGARSQVFDAAVRYLSRGYDEVEASDYNMLDASGTLKLGRRSQGRAGALLQMRLRKRTNNDANKDLNHQELNPRAILNIGPSGPELMAEVQFFSLTEVDDAEGDNVRYKAHLHFVGGSGTSRHGPEVQYYKFPNVPDGDPDPGYADLGYRIQKSSRGKRSELHAFYRLHEDDQVFDFVQGSFRFNSVGSSRQITINLSGRYFTEGKDEVLIQDYGQAVLHPPHEIDAFLRFLWTKSGTGNLKRIGIGPIIGHTMFLDTQNNEIVEDVQIDDPPDLVFANPRNLAKAGLQGTAEIAPAPQWTVRFDGRYEYSVNYNGSPQTKTMVYSFRGNADWRVHPQATIVAKLDLHNASIADALSPAENERMEVSVFIRYLVDSVI